MKLLSLNLWGGTQGQVLLDYLREEAETTDIFCFQEVFSSLPGAPQSSSGARMFLFEELSALLQEFTPFFSPRSFGADFVGLVNFPVSHGLAVFVKRGLQIIGYNDRVIETNDIATMVDPVEGWTKAQVLTLSSGVKKFSVINFHGVAHPGNKLDTTQRISQMSKLKLVWESIPEKDRILCGDFNMYPEIESIKILESISRNLIKDFNIKNTRNEHSWKKYPESHQTFADFTFVSKGLKVKAFEVPYNEVSDHLPMILEFDI